ncbi:RAQPRD family integrative conjugative element protein [Proteus terrae]|uniref:integrative conjugative element protein, RAQPRD family n=1 Tax=Proteus terrae TaxID=1574161 RepID=UPI003C2EE104
MRIIQMRTWYLLGILITPLAYASESNELALAIKQLDYLDARLASANVEALKREQPGRFYLDYQQIKQDIEAIRQGLKHYLNPSRAQPSALIPFSAQYQQEHHR